MRLLGTVAAIGRYPVKSLQGEALDAGRLGASGLEHDRAWGIVERSSGHLMTAKRTARLLDARAWITASGLAIELPGGTVLTSPGAATDQALSDWLGASVALRPAGGGSISFEMSFNVDDPEADKFEWSTPEGSFHDLAPVHVLTTAALAAAAERYPDGSWSPHRFRPTLLVETGEDEKGFVENAWVGASLAVGDAIVEVTMPTVRCSLPVKAQPLHGLERDTQVFKSLAAHNNQNLGAYANVVTPATVRLGDPVRLLP